MSMTWPINPLNLTQTLIRYPSVTPAGPDIVDLLVNTLSPVGFSCYPLVFGNADEDQVSNLYARIGTKAPNLCVAGHVDVVPADTPELWKYPPFEPTIDQGLLYGRGAADMKAAVACFIAAASRFLQDYPNFPGSLSFLITGDEEGEARFGTRAVLDYLTQKGETIDACVVGEPTNPFKIGEMIKIGRRGSLNCEVSFIGKAGHVAYPHLARNPIYHMSAFINYMHTLRLDEGNEFFDPSNLEVVNCSTSNTHGTRNVIPEIADCHFNIRFNNNYSGQQLMQMVADIVYDKQYVKDNPELMAQMDGVHNQVSARISGEPFILDAKHIETLLNPLIFAIKQHTPCQTITDTSGGTSDARFFHQYHIPAIEFGMTNQTIHQINEHVRTQDIELLSLIYYQFLCNYFNTNIKQ